MGNVRWNSDELKYLKENYGIKKLDDIAEYLNKTVLSVKHKAEREGIKSQRKWTDEQIQYLINNYH